MLNHPRILETLARQAIESHQQEARNRVLLTGGSQPPRAGRRRSLILGIRFGRLVRRSAQ